MSTSNAARQIKSPDQEIPIKLSEISNLVKVEQHIRAGVMPLTLTGPKPE
jgi:hypothetical protein